MDFVTGTNSELWSIIVGFFMPLLIAVINREGWSERQKAIVAFLACLVVSAGVNYMGGTFVNGGMQEMIRNFLILIVTSISTFKGWWKPIGVSDMIEKKING